jgi:MFS family permease
MAIYRRTQDYESNKALLILSIIVMAAGILILLSTFMTWTAGQTGWSLKGSFNQGDRSYSSNPFYSYGGDVYLLFSGLCSLILGALTALAGLVMLASFTRLLSGLAVFTSFVASVMAIFNTVTISRLGSGMGSGMYVFLISALVALVASAMAQSSPFLVPRATEVDRGRD